MALYASRSVSLRLATMPHEHQSTYGKNASDITEDVARVERNISMQEKEKALVRKIDLFLLPTIWLMYLLSYIDRTKSVQSIIRVSSTYVWQYWQCKDCRHAG